MVDGDRDLGRRSAGVGKTGHPCLTRHLYEPFLQSLYRDTLRGLHKVLPSLPLSPFSAKRQAPLRLADALRRSASDSIGCETSAYLEVQTDTASQTADSAPVVARAGQAMRHRWAPSAITMLWARSPGPPSNDQKVRNVIG